jgi:hypothetical protein
VSKFAGKQLKLWRVSTAFVLGVRILLQVAIATKRIAGRPLVEQLTVKKSEGIRGIRLINEDFQQTRIFRVNPLATRLRALKRAILLSQGSVFSPGGPWPGASTDGDASAILLTD